MSEFSNKVKAEEWIIAACVVSSPFNMEKILNSCPELLAYWKKHPFTFEIDDCGRIITRYISVKD